MSQPTREQVAEAMYYAKCDYFGETTTRSWAQSNQKMYLFVADTILALLVNSQGGERAAPTPTVFPPGYHTDSTNFPEAQGGERGAP